MRARRPMHGKVSRIIHEGAGILAGLPSPFFATRYHSLVIEASSFPDSLRVTATTEDGEIMAVEHRTHPVVGVQFHPESALTEHGYLLLDTFLHGARPVGDRMRAALPDRADGGHAANTSTDPRAESAGPGGEHRSLDSAPPPVSLVH